mmetsp:Transcript_52532/g.97259  ORF Transcript_52532/g.97259 Transcript_52532/m.97259 type:complete len:268 (+) Transcript_52532:79-882(+)
MGGLDAWDIFQDVLKPFIIAFCIGITSGLACIGTKFAVHWLKEWLRRKVSAWWLQKGHVKTKIFLNSLDDDTNSPRLEKIKKELCSVCLCELSDEEKMEDLLEAPCGHIFHDDCLRGWLLKAGDPRKMVCPLCRSPAMVTQCVQLCLRPQCQHAAATAASKATNAAAANNRGSGAAAGRSSPMNSPSGSHQEHVLSEVLARSGEMLRSMRSWPVGSSGQEESAPPFNSGLVPDLPGMVNASLEDVEVSSFSCSEPPSPAFLESHVSL